MGTRRHTLSFAEERPSVLELEPGYKKAHGEFRGGKIDDCLCIPGRTLGLPLKRGREGDDQRVSYHRPSGAREIMFGVFGHRVPTGGESVPTSLWAENSFLFGLLAARRVGSGC